MKKIAFHTNQLCLRGTEVAVYDYALFNRLMLDNESVVLYNRNSPTNDVGAIEKFKKEFDVYGYDDIGELDGLVKKSGADLFYSIKSGEVDNRITRQVPNLVHAVFPVRDFQYHGAVFAYISDWLSINYSNGKVPVVPHIVTLPDVDGDLREPFGIPESATVFGCYGGAQSFDIDFVKSTAIPAVLSRRKDVYFLFMNIEKFIEHERVLFVSGSANLIYKTKFINTSDAMLHARKLGESFGLACGEFSIRNKPIFTYSRSMQTNHIFLNPNNPFLYRDAKELIQKILDFDRRVERQKNWDFYSERFSPESVMNAFKEVFIDKAESSGNVLEPGIELSAVDRAWVKFRHFAIKARRSGILP